MPYINLPPVVSEMFWDLDKRIRALETAYRFNFPNVNFLTNEPSNPNTGDAYYDTNAYQLKYWDGTQWVVIADNNVGSPKVPFTSTWAGTGLTYTNSPASGNYIKIGKMIFFDIYVSTANVTNFGTGQYSLTVPFAPDNHYIVTQGGLHDASTGNHYEFRMDLVSGSTTGELYYLSSNGRNLAMTGNQPLNLAVGDYFYISGTYFVP